MNIEERLKEISKIVNFQRKRLKDSSAVNKDLVLRQALDIIITYIGEIELELVK